jgi:rhodanese-related sulfurtransferase
MNISPENAKQLKDAEFIDVREKDEWDAGHIEGAKLLPLGAFLRDIGQWYEKCLKTKTPIIFYCRTGGRSSMAVDSLRRLGISQVYNLTGGWKAWNKHPEER